MKKLILATFVGLTSLAAGAAAPIERTTKAPGLTSWPSVSGARSQAQDGEWLAIHAQLNQWRRAWQASQSAAARFEQVYVAGSAVRAVAARSGLAGWQITAMSVDQITVLDSLATTVISFRKLDSDGHTTAHQAKQVWRKDNGQWRILHEHVDAAAEGMQTYLARKNSVQPSRLWR